MIPTDFKKTYTLLFAFILLISTNSFAQTSQTFTLKSNDLGGQVTDSFFANTFGCVGKNISPELNWENAPAETKAFAITIYDKDAPTGSGFWHWILYNIPAEVTQIKAGAGNSQLTLPTDTIIGLNDAGSFGFLGACPPKGDREHMYVITVYALSSKLTIDRMASPALIGFNLNYKTLAKASLVVYGKRN